MPKNRIFWQDELPFDRGEPLFERLLAGLEGLHAKGGRGQLRRRAQEPSERRRHRIYLQVTRIRFRPYTYLSLILIHHGSRRRGIL